MAHFQLGILIEPRDNSSETVEFYTYDEEITRSSGFSQSAEKDSHCFNGPEGVTASVPRNRGLNIESFTTFFL